MSVYFIRPVGMASPVKIGWSCDPERRCFAMSGSSPFPLEVVATADGDMRMELQFHAMFAHLHERREWFRADEALTSTIEAVSEGLFDFSSLPPPQALFVINKRRTGKRRLAGQSAEQMCAPLTEAA